MEELIARVLSGEADDLERRRLHQWRRAAPENESAYLAMEEVWLLTGPDDPPADLPAPPTARKIVERAGRPSGYAFPLRGRLPAHARRARRWPWAVAAAAVVTVAVSLGVVRLDARPDEIYAAVAGAAMSVPLADGSVARLAPGSRLEVWTDDPRRVRAAGKVFFAVAADPDRPFLVQAEAGQVRVLGTRFELDARPRSLRLAVLEGVVELSAAGTAVEVPQGAVSRVVGDAAPSPPESTDVGSLLDWPDGLLLFQATPLEQVAAEVAAHFGRPVVVRDPALARRTVTVWFESESFEDVVTTICEIVGARCTVGEAAEVGQ